MTDDAVFEVQSYLRNIGRLDRDISRVVPDGIFGSETTEAVKSFQRKYGISETGIVDFETWESIKNKNSEAVFTASEPIQVVRITNEDLPLIKGTDNALVYTLHLMLNKLAESYANFTLLPLQSLFGENTEREVMRWQRVISHEETGEVDKLTWNSLAEFYLLPTDTPR
ncbi:MAG: peptidoglycan-binding protein [Clostridia bacterium]|nr:peptidoglycan-binding protein [Clostridia bacterium]